jgi:putative SOS response-associated peptidase YedK
LTWGLLPHWTPDRGSAPRPIHARAETVAKAPMFANAFRRRRAIVPMKEYFQRRTIDEPVGQRFAISRSNGAPMPVAGIWESFRATSGEILRTYCIITIPATGAVATIHDRMPLVLEERDWPLWLGELAGDPSTLLRPSPEDVLVIRPIDEERSVVRSRRK